MAPTVEGRWVGVTVVLPDGVSSGKVVAGFSSPLHFSFPIWSFTSNVINMTTMYLFFTRVGRDY